MHAQIERAARDTRKLDPTSPFLVGLPLGRSGDDAADWLPQFLQVEKTFGVQAHVLLVSEISDLAAILGPIPEAETESFNARIVQQVPMFVIHTMRSLLTTDGYTPRQLRFAVGPTVQPLTKSKSNEKVDRVIQWDLAFGQLAEVTQRPVIVVYAPVIPNITDGKVVSRDSHAGEFDRLMRAANSLDMTVLDMRDAFRRSADTGQWPHGFHNGLIGSGHINSVGYRLIAHSVADAIPQIVTDWE